MMQAALLVSLGGALGALARFLLAQAVGLQLFPYATLVINIAGSFLIGAVWGAFADSGWFQEWGRALLVTGVLGGFTTYSAFALDAVQLLQEQRWLAVMGYVGATVIGCILGCWAGFRWLA